MLVIWQYYRYVWNISNLQMHCNYPANTKAAHLLLTIQISVEIPAKIAARIVEAHLLVNAVDLLHILWLELEIALQVGGDPTLSFGLGDNRPAMSNSPRKRYLRAALAVLLPNLDQDRVFHQLPKRLALCVDFILVAERRILSDVDAHLLVPSIKSRLL
jgi:hypothetical protein